MSFIQVEPGVHLFVQDWGTGKPVVFLHGWPLSSAMFEYQMTELAENGYRCIGIDLRGFGQSDKPWSDYTFDMFADDVKKAFVALKVEEATLVGFSMGGAVTVRYMAQHQGAHVSRIVLMSAATPCLTKKSDFPQGLDTAPYDAFIQAVKTDRAKMNVDFGQATFNKPLSSARAQWFTDMGMQASPRATIQGLVALRDSDLRSDLTHIHVPTLILHGIQDKIAPIDLTAEVNHKKIAGSRLVRFEESGHGLFLDEQQRCNRELLRFLD